MITLSVVNTRYVFIRTEWKQGQYRNGGAVLVNEATQIAGQMVERVVMDMLREWNCSNKYLYLAATQGTRAEREGEDEVQVNDDKK